MLQTMNKWYVFLTKLLSDFTLSASDFANQYGLKSFKQIYSNLKADPNKGITPATIKRIERALNIKINYSDLNNLSYSRLSFSSVSLTKYPILNYIYRGEPSMVFKEIPLDYLYVPYHQKECFGYKAKDKSMEPTISIDDVVLIDLIRPVMEGNIVAVLLTSGEELIRRYHKAGSNIILNSDNTDHPPRIVAEDQIDKIYRVIKIIKDAK